MPWKNPSTSTGFETWNLRSRGEIDRPIEVQGLSADYWPLFHFTQTQVKDHSATLGMTYVQYVDTSAVVDFLD